MTRQNELELRTERESDLDVIINGLNSQAQEHEEQARLAHRRERELTTYAGLCIAGLVAMEFNKDFDVLDEVGVAILTQGFVIAAIVERLRRRKLLKIAKRKRGVAEEQALDPDYDHIG